MTVINNAVRFEFSVLELPEESIECRRVMAVLLAAREKSNQTQIDRALITTLQDLRSATIKRIIAKRGAEERLKEADRELSEGLGLLRELSDHFGVGIEKMSDADIIFATDSRPSQVVSENYPGGLIVGVPGSL